MSRQYPGHNESRRLTPLKRRGLMAGLAALATGALAKAAPRVEAQTNPSWLLNQVNSSTGATELDYNGSPGNPTLVIRNPSNDGIQSVASGSLSYGVWGDNSTGFGTVGTSSSGTGVSGGTTSGTGVSGDSNSGTGVAGFSDTGPGVYGSSTAAGSTQPGVSGVGTAGPGVSGASTSGYGVYGANPNGFGVVGSSSSTTSGTAAVYGTNSAGVGVFGFTGGSTGGVSIGVLGSTSSGRGVEGSTSGSGQIGVLGWGSGTNGFGIYGKGDGSGGTGVYGYANDSGGYGVYGYNANASGKAAVFDGPVVITGPLTVQGQNHKAAAVPYPDGFNRLLYCQESPEPWFEDFGSAALVGGRVTVTLDPEFAGIVITDNYRVFLTPEGDCKGLYVSSKTPTGFVVQELQGGTSGLTFSYRVVARRKDIPGPRLMKVPPFVPLRPAVNTELPPAPPQAPTSASSKAVGDTRPGAPPLPPPVQAPTRNPRR
ncbi:MAG TPA: hypothetical protein VII06_30505 [Chloroflexota bacterium]|jgi:hypothetical protein